MTSIRTLESPHLERYLCLKTNEPPQVHEIVKEITSDLIQQRGFEADHISENTHLKVSTLQGGLTNVLFKVRITWKDGSQPTEYLNVRVFGEKSAEIIDREAELRTMILLDKMGQAPPLHATFENGVIYGYVPGNVLCPIELMTGKYDQLVASKMAEWHASSTLLSGQPLKIWTTIQKWLIKATNLAPVWVPELDIKRVNKMIVEIRSLVELDSHPTGFCHNDLLPGNIIIHPDRTSVSFIDFEYAGSGFCAYDIGNHFLERTVNYNNVTCDWSRYPDDISKESFATHYLSRFTASGGTSSLDARSFAASFDLFASLSAIYWSLWGVIQASSTKLSFDYASFALLRLEQASEMLSRAKSSYIHNP